MAQALAAHGIEPRLIFSGQHPGLDPEDHGFPRSPVSLLGCPGREDPDEHVSVVKSAMLPLLSSKPDLLIVQGDTSTALGAAQAGCEAGIPVAHVEAGLRSHDRAMPWPEEGYRTAIDAVAALLFAPTALAAANLRAEGVRGQVYVTGNTSVDALLALAAELPRRTKQADGIHHLLVTCHRRENWGERLRSVCAALREIANRHAVRMTVVLPPNRHIASELGRLLAGEHAIELINSCSHSALIARMHSADLLLSDSGGVQEEAPALGVPLLVLREKSERPEAIWSGSARLVGSDRQRIVAAVDELFGDPSLLAAMSRPALPFGDGTAGRQIAAHVADWLAQLAKASSPTGAAA